jgi:hypothetical protein
VVCSSGTEPVHYSGMPRDPLKTPKPTPHRRPESPASETPASEPSSAKDHYEREKARRAQDTSVDNEAMASARREYRAMLEASAAKGKGGRPKKQAARPKVEDDVEDTDVDDA